MPFTLFRALPPKQSIELACLWPTMQCFMVDQNDQGCGMRVLTSIASLLVLAGCTEHSSEVSRPQPEAIAASSHEVRDFGQYKIYYSRYGCVIENSFRRSSVNMSYSYHILSISTAGRRTSAVYAINCEPTPANGTSICHVIPQSVQPPHVTAGPGCPAWTEFRLTRF